ncbi:MAG: M56 family metallopeptidase [Chloroflexota bacterium]
MRTFWNITEVVSSYWGMYAVQSVLHSAIAAVLVDGALLAWNVRTPRVRQLFRFTVILVPVVSFPVYQAVFPRRGDAFFRLDSLVDSNRWFFLELWSGVPLFVLFVAGLAVVTLAFVVQELLPVVSSLIGHVRGGGESEAEPVETGVSLKVAKAIESLPLPEDSIEIVHDEDLMLFSSTGLNPRIYVSTGLVDSFSVEHLQVAIAHEIGHIQRSRRPILILAYVLRVFMFFNPVAMIEFRRLAQEEEKVCDDIAVSLTGDAKALAEAIEMLRPSPEEYHIESGSRSVGNVASAIEQYSHDVLLKARILRLGQNAARDALWGIPYIVTLALIVSINYFVV